MTWLLWPILLLAPLQPPGAQRQVMDTLEGNELAKTQARLEQAARREPNNARAWLELARVYAQRKKAEQALAAADKAEALAGDDARVLDELARLFIELQPDLKKAAGPNGVASGGGAVPGSGAATAGDRGRPPRTGQRRQPGTAHDSGPGLHRGTRLGQCGGATESGP